MQKHSARYFSHWCPFRYLFFIPCYPSKNRAPSHPLSRIHLTPGQAVISLRHVQGTDPQRRWRTGVRRGCHGRGCHGRVPSRRVIVRVIVDVDAREGWCEGRPDASERASARAAARAAAGPAWRRQMGADVEVGRLTREAEVCLPVHKQVPSIINIAQCK